LPVPVQHDQGSVFREEAVASTNLALRFRARRLCRIMGT
jgi:hypothetical protein